MATVSSDVSGELRYLAWQYDRSFRLGRDRSAELSRIAWRLRQLAGQIEAEAQSSGELVQLRS